MPDNTLQFESDSDFHLKAVEQLCTQCLPYIRPPRNVNPFKCLHIHRHQRCNSSWTRQRKFKWKFKVSIWCFSWHPPNCWDFSHLVLKLSKLSCQPFTDLSFSNPTWKKFRDHQIVFKVCSIISLLISTHIYLTKWPQDNCTDISSNQLNNEQDR